jgi:hypothetical protein
VTGAARTVRPDQPARGLLLIAYNRPSALRGTLVSLHRALAELNAERPSESTPIFVALDGPRSTATDQAATREVAQLVSDQLPRATVIAQSPNRGLPALLVDTLDRIFGDHQIEELICVEDDVELSATALLALFAAASHTRQKHGASFVIGGAPLHRDGSLEHQLLLITRSAWTTARALLVEYIARFSLEGANAEGAYGNRDHASIAAWSSALAAEHALTPPRGTSQDRMRELAWRISGVTLIGLPIRVVRHRGLWGQHNTPWHALRTGQLFQRLDRRPWSSVSTKIRDLLEP